MQEVEVIEGAEEFEVGDGRVAVLLVHGFTGSPQGMRLLGEHLAGNGFTVRAPRLAGHGTTWQDLSTYSSDDWVASVDDAFHTLTRAHARVFVAGLSFGAALALDLAARYPDRVAGVVALSGLIRPTDPRRFFAPAIARVVKSVRGVGNDIADPSQKELAYDRLPAAATVSMLRFLKRARLGLGAVRSSTLVVHSRIDHVVHPSNARIIYKSVSSTDKELVWLDRSYHVITLDCERERVFETVQRFLKERAYNAN
ncbi:MAG: alpha/beta fold hydrolase [Actinobacteria bacterium]|nr:alpha/beta fold hydrolase [Actinomycetota bacterium]